jgi:hypothetical protein
LRTLRVRLCAIAAQWPERAIQWRCWREDGRGGMTLSERNHPLQSAFRRIVTCLLKKMQPSSLPRMMEPFFARVLERLPKSPGDRRASHRSCSPHPYIPLLRMPFPFSVSTKPNSDGLRGNLAGSMNEFMRLAVSAAESPWTSWSPPEKRHTTCPVPTHLFQQPAGP